MSLAVEADASRYDASSLLQFTEALLVAAGMPAEKAAAVADVLVDGDLLGHATHGVQLLPAYLEEIAGGGMTLVGEPELLSDFGAVVTWDGRRLPGAWLALRAIHTASERARRFGLGVVSIRRSHHIAALATYARRVADEGLVLLLMSSAPAGASVAPFGGTRALLSPSPIAVGFPTGGDPVCVDVSTSITTNTMTGLLARQGRKLPGPWVMDEAGVPTDDPSVVVQPRKGTLLPLGGTDAGHKGYGLALMVEALTAGLAGHGRLDPAARWGATLFVQVLDPAAFSGAAAFAAQMDGVVAQCHANPPVDPQRPVRLPGERGLQLRQQQLAHGILLKEATVSPLRFWAVRLGVGMPDPTPPAPGSPSDI
jgi:LDH2 family malate/lactate/ureidoglycolate dehydrogenase